MGAEPYEFRAPWHVDPNDALRAAQANFFLQNYDLAEIIEQSLANAKESVTFCQEGGDEYNLLEFYQREVQSLESLASQQIPETEEEQIKVLRKVCEFSGEGIGNLLDIKSVDKVGDFFVTRVLSEAELTNLFGTDRPTLSQAKRLLDLMADKIDRAEGLCCPIHEDDEPVGWWFVGYTID